MDLAKDIEKLKGIPGFDEEFFRSLFVEGWRFRRINRQIPEFYGAYLRKTMQYGVFFDFFEAFHTYLIGYGIGIGKCKAYFSKLSERMGDKARESAKRQMGAAS